jgi:hypothetical protein
MVIEKAEAVGGQSENLFILETKLGKPLWENYIAP